MAATFFWNETRNLIEWNLGKHCDPRSWCKMLYRRGHAAWWKLRADRPDKVLLSHAQGASFDSISCRACDRIDKKETNKNKIVARCYGIPGACTFHSARLLQTAPARSWSSTAWAWGEDAGWGVEALEEFGRVYPRSIGLHNAVVPGELLGALVRPSFLGHCE